jgi:hypothetical protein
VTKSQVFLLPVWCVVYTHAGDNAKFLLLANENKDVLFFLLKYTLEFYSEEVGRGVTEPQPKVSFH